MKKSSLILTICLASIIVCLIVTNLKLAAEYNEGHIKSNQVFVGVPTFHHIKQLQTSKNDIADGNITYIEKIDSTGIVHTYLDTLGINYYVKNDTLHLEPLPIKNKQGYLYNFIIYGNKLQSVSTETANITIQNLTTDSLKIMAKNYTSLRALNLKVKALNLLVKDQAQISISATDTIPFANINVFGWGIFSAYDLVILKKKITLSPGSTIRLTGASVGSFGIKQKND